MEQQAQKRRAYAACEEVSTMPDSPAPPVVAHAPAPAPDPLLLEMGNLPPPGTAGAPARIPYQRFHSVVQARDAAAAELQALRAELDQAKAQNEEWAQKWEPVSQWETERDQIQQQHAQALTGVREEYELRAIGLEDPELVEAARWAYSRTPEDGRPPFVEALKGWATDPGTAPVLLRPHLQGAQPAPPPGAAPGPAPAPAPAPAYQWPRSNAGAPPAPPAPAGRSTITTAQYQQMRREGKTALEIQRAHDVEMPRR